MANCKLTQNISKKFCEYDVAGVAEVYLINHERDLGKVDAATGELTEMPSTAVAYRVDFLDNTASFTDELAEGGNGGKYRTHTLNFSIGADGYKTLNAEKDALSLAKFIAIVVDRNDNRFVLGRTNGLSATSFNYDSGAADADAKGWTVVMAATEKESAPTISDSVFASIKKAENTDIVVEG